MPAVKNRNTPSDFAGLKAVFINCTLKPPTQKSHTELLMRASSHIMETKGVEVEFIRPTAHQIAFGVYPDMTGHGATHDDWPKLWKKIKSADILVIGTPIWLGEESSVCRVVIERLYAMAGELNAKGQSVFYGKVGGFVITGNEDGIKHCAMTLGFTLNHLGYTIPPQADCGWIGEAGPGPSYGDDGTGFDNDFTRRNTTIMTWNLLHMARLLKDADGLPNEGNDRRAFKKGEKFGFKTPSPLVSKK